MKNALFLAAIFVAIPCSATPPECDLHDFPDFWADAQSRVQKLNSYLERSERANPYSSASIKPFRESLKVCESKRKAIFNDPRASGGTTTQMKCEAVLICSRLAVFEL